jgi:hypothetical protein
MDHEVVVRQKLSERYLLNELDSEARDEFEEHFFGCPECAFDVRAGSAFVDRTKTVLAETHEAGVVSPSPVPGYRPWYIWLRPALTAPVLALLLTVVGYQNLVIVPRLKQALAAQVLPWAAVNIGTYGDAAGQEITTAPGKGFLVFVRIPPQNNTYSHYTVDLFNPAAQLEWSVTIPSATNQDQWPVMVPGADRQAGTYNLKVRGTTNAGESVKVGQGSFELHIQN